MTLGERIREIRKTKGLSILDLKEKTGLSKSTISDIENGKSSPTTETLQKIANALGVDIREFFGNTDKENLTSNDLDDLLLEFPEGIYVLRRANKELSPEAKKQMIKIMKAFLEEDN